MATVLKRNVRSKTDAYLFSWKTNVIPIRSETTEPYLSFLRALKCLIKANATENKLPSAVRVSFPRKDDFSTVEVDATGTPLTIGKLSWLIPFQ